MNCYQTNYLQSECAIGVVHIGFGAFHRAHQAVYFDDYMQESGDLAWGIAAVNLHPNDASWFKKLSHQDQKDQGSDHQGYLLKTTSAKGDESYRLVRPHLAFMDWNSQKEHSENLLALPSVQLVTITITEGGYYLDKKGNLNIDDDTIKQEIHLNQPKTIYGFLMKALEKRSQHDNSKLTIICCDNITANGRMFKRNFIDFLEQSQQFTLKQWVEKNVSFPCAMVDRITPRINEKTISEIVNHFPHHADKAIHAVNAEDFSQWVIEDNFMGKKPCLDQVGVEFVQDVSPYEEAKIRILNGGHTSLAYFGALKGYHTFDQLMNDHHCRSFFDQWQDHEVLPGITRELPLDKRKYKNTVAERFSNQAIADTLERICMDGFIKFAIFIKPTIESCLKQNITPDHSYQIIASWYIYARSIAAGNSKTNYIDSNWAILEPLLSQGQEEQFASLELLWEDLPSIYPQFKQDLLKAINKMEFKWLA